MPKLSVIVPVYNAEGYLDRAVDSVLAQTFADWELLLVDDGSTDGSAALCDRRAAGDGRIRAIHQQNAGPSAARNAGLDAARGDYAAFLDADDWLDPEMYARMFTAMAAGGADCACCGYTMAYDTGPGEVVPPPLPEGTHPPEAVLDAVVLPLLQDRLRVGAFTGMAWRWIFPLDALRQRGVRFPDAGYMEDELFLIRFFALPRSLACVDAGLYQYYQSPGSITRRWFPDLTGTFLRVLEAKADAVAAFSLPVRDDWRDNSAWAGLLAAAGNEFAPGAPGPHPAHLKALCAVPEFCHALEHYRPEGMNKRKTLVAALLRRRMFLTLSALYAVKNRGR